MSGLREFLQQDWVYSLAWTLVHSLWQFALVTVFCALLLLIAKNFSAAIRYLLALGSLVLGLLISAITFDRYQRAQSEIVIYNDSPGTFVSLSTHDNRFSIDTFINNHIETLIMVWLAGFLLFGLSTLRSYGYSQQLKHQHLVPTPKEWLVKFAVLTQRVGANAKTDLRLSTLIISPCVIGHLKPVVLLPVGILLQMNQQQVEAILLHELAHVRRQDFLVGLLQALLKNLFFFNPFVYWICNQIDKEREYACDDFALTITNDPMLFANTLKEFADMNIHQSNAMRITGKKILLARITRLFRKQKPAAALEKSLLTSIFIGLSSLTIALCVNAETDKLNSKKISIDVANVDAQTVLNEINQRCGTTQTLATGSNEKLTLVLEDISCKDALQLVIDFASGSTETEALSEKR